MRRITPSVEFFENAMLADTDECITWPYRKLRGYPLLWIGGKLVRAARLACERQNGPPPDAKLESAHNCGNRSCINRRHLRWATSAENCADKIIHGTSTRGERNWSARLCKSDVLTIKDWLASGFSNKEIAKHFSVAETTICCISTGRNWAWLGLGGL